MKNDKWWQRLLKVLFGVFSLVVLVASYVYFYSDTVDNVKIVYTYNLDSNYPTAKGEEHKCIEIWDCGDITDSQVVDKSTALSPDPEYSQAARETINDDSAIARAIMLHGPSRNGKSGVWVKTLKVFSVEDYVRIIFYPLITTALFIGLSILVYRVVLYIVYGKRIIPKKTNQVDTLEV